MKIVITKDDGTWYDSFSVTPLDIKQNSISPTLTKWIISAVQDLKKEEEKEIQDFSRPRD